MNEILEKPGCPKERQKTQTIPYAVRNRFKRYYNYSYITIVIIRCRTYTYLNLSELFFPFNKTFLYFYFLYFVLLFPSCIRYARACSTYACFILSSMRLSNKYLEQGYVSAKRLISSLLMVDIGISSNYLKSPCRECYNKIYIPTTSFDQT